MKKVIDSGKRSKTLSEVKPVGNINKNQQSFLEICPVQKEVLPSHKLRDDAYEYWNPFRLKELIESSRFVSHRARISAEFDSRKDSQSTKFEQRPQIFVKLRISFRELSDSKLSGLHAFDNMAIIH